MRRPGATRPPTRQLINSVKAAGFNAIRIPISWNCHITDGSTNIPADWMTRVKQVVDMAIGQNMYVIINIHWDGGWLQDHVTEADRIPVNARQNALWTQIATTFRTYDQRLLFAGTNEVHADFGTPTADAHLRAAVVQPDLRERSARHRRQQCLALAGRADLQHERPARPGTSSRCRPTRPRTG